MSQSLERTSLQRILEHCDYASAVMDEGVRPSQTNARELIMFIHQLAQELLDSYEQAAMRTGTMTEEYKATLAKLRTMVSKQC